MGRLAIMIVGMLVEVGTVNEGQRAREGIIAEGRRNGMNKAACRGEPPLA